MKAWIPVALLALAACSAQKPETSAGASARKRPTNLAVVLLSKAVLPDAKAVAAALPAYERGTRGVRLTPRAEHPARTLEFDAGACGSTLVALMPAAVPNGEADDSARFSLSSIGSGWKLPPHEAHLVVATMGGGPSKLENLSCFTSIVAAVTEVSPALGVYSAAAGATHDPRFFTSMARGDGIAPKVILWNGVSIATEKDDRFSLLSLGMKQLDLPDLLLVVPSASTDEAVPLLFDLLAYLAERGEPIAEGDTVGRTEEERLRVHYVSSPIDPMVQVWRVQVE